MLSSLFTTFGMYSRIPVPEVEWNDRNRRYALCFFPLVGAVIGGLLMLWNAVCRYLDIGSFLYAAGAVLITVLVTGGIHLDGYCDTCDARASWGDREKKLKILSDPHIGAFAAIKLCMYLIVLMAVFTELTDKRAAFAAACGYVVSRSLSGLAAVTFRAAKKEGSLYSFTSAADKKTTAVVLVLWAVLGCGAMIAASPVTGIISSAAALLTMAYYRFTVYRCFGGITGDLAGWFLQVCELMVAASAALTYRIMEVM